MKDKIYYFQEKSNDILDLQDELTAEEIGIYFILKAGYFKYAGELREENLCQRCKFFGSKEKLKEVKEKIFEVKDGLLVNNAWLSEIQTIKDRSIKRREAAMSRWNPEEESKTEAKASKSKQKVVNLAVSVSDSKKESDSKKPTLQQIKDYCLERKNSVNPEKWLNHYESNGWKVGKNSMKDWKAAVRTWENSDYNNPPPKNDLLTKLNLIAGFDAFKSIEECEESVSLYAIDTLKVSALAEDVKDKIKAQFINKKIILR